MKEIENNSNYILKENNNENNSYNASYFKNNNILNCSISSTQYNYSIYDEDIVEELKNQIINDHNKNNPMKKYYNTAINKIELPIDDE